MTPLTDILTVRINDQRVPFSELVAAWKSLNVSEARGDGQGVGGAVQRDGGADTCVCPECGATTPHARGVPCAEVKCPECGTNMAGETEDAAEETESMEFAESASGAAMEVLSEGQTDAAESANGPLVITAKLINPGWGNKRDNNYYSREMLARDANVFVGAKMYETDHRQLDKSTKSWVSTVRKIVKFLPNGAPVAEVVIHNPDFAQRVRNLDEAGMLSQLPASILANGTARKGEIDGRKGRIIESITEARSVDWVTKAGAGGQAMEIVSESEPDNVTEDIMAEKATEEKTVIVEKVTVEESTQEVTLSIMQAAALLTESGLPTVAIERLAEGDYPDAETLKKAIASEKAYLEAALKVATPEVKEEPVAESEPAPKAESVVTGNGAGKSAVIQENVKPDYSTVDALLGWNPNQS